jgi:hypothetical protein
MCSLLQSYPKYIRLKGGRTVVNKRWIAEQKRLKVLRESRDLLKRLNDKRNSYNE